MIPQYLRVVLSLMLCLVLLNSCYNKEEVYHIGVLQWTEQIQPFTLTYQGVIDSLTGKGYMDGVNLKLSYRNVEQDKNAALQAASEFVNAEVDLILTLGTGSTLAALEATRDNKIPIIFTIVGAPKATSIIKSYDDSGANITGVSMKIPIEQQYEFIRDLLPGLSTLGILYCSEMPQAVATGEEAEQAVTLFGWGKKTSTLTIDELPRLREYVKELGKGVDAIYIPTDPILGTPENMKMILEITDSLGVPVISVAREFVEQGVLAAVHSDFYELGRQTGEPVSQVLTGVDVSTIPSQKPIVRRISLNLNKAKALNLNIRRNIILQSDFIIN